MNDKEKAKAYDEALEQAKKELATCGSLNCDAARFYSLSSLYNDLKKL